MVKEFETSDRQKNEQIKQLAAELKRKERDILHLTQHIAELKDVLQQSVKPKARPEHRMGE